MTLLTRYLLRHNLFLLFCILLIGTGIYLLTDLFDRLDNFLDTGLGFFAVCWYFAVKIPLIISQILPAVFLLAVIAQVSFMTRNKEMLALQAGGVSPATLVRFIVVYGLIWAAVQLFFSQAVGVQGEKLAARIWKEQVRGKEVKESVLRGLWFTDGLYVVHLGMVYPETETGTDILVYRLAPQGNAFEQLIRAESFRVASNGWVLHHAEIFEPDSFLYTSNQELLLPITQQLSAFLAVEPGANPSHLPVWDLNSHIAQLVQSGSNVEGLRTAFHAKLAYAASLVVMGLLALAVVLWKDSIYIAVGLGLCVTFIFYACATFFTTLGEKGILTPFAAAWAPDVLFLVTALAGIAVKIKPQLPAIVPWPRKPAA